MQWSPSEKTTISLSSVGAAASSISDAAIGIIGSFPPWTMSSGYPLPDVGAIGSTAPHAARASSSLLVPQAATILAKKVVFPRASVGLMTPPLQQQADTRLSMDAMAIAKLPLLLFPINPTRCPAVR